MGVIVEKLLLVGRITLKIYVLTKKVDVTSSILPTSAFLMDWSSIFTLKNLRQTETEPQVGLEWLPPQFLSNELY